MLIVRGSSDLTAFRNVYISLQYKFTYADTGDFVMCSSYSLVPGD